MRVLHLTALGTSKNNNGIINQLEYEKIAVESLNINWDTLLITDSYINTGDTRLKDFIIYPSWFKYRIMKRYFVYRAINKLKSRYDIIILRYLPIDIFLFLSNFKNTKLFFIHHTKEGKVYNEFPNTIVSNIYRILDFFLFRLNEKKVHGFLAVTKDIIQYEYLRGYSKLKKSYCIPNGIILNNNKVYRSTETRIVKLVFVSTLFYSWQGLEVLLESINNYTGVIDFELHIIGDLNDAQLVLLNNNQHRNRIYKYGKLNAIEISNVLTHCDLGLSMLNSKKILNEATTLKVREYLNLGLGVYSQIGDSALPCNFEYFKIGEPNIEDILRFGLKIKETDKMVIKNMAKEFIDKVNIIKNTYSWLLNNFN
jgi:glycosyltransferase involved in cell wall biosynthesis